MPRPEDSGGPTRSRHERMLLYCLRCTLKSSASAIAISKLYQHFRARDHPGACPGPDPGAYTILCLRLAHLVRCMTFMQLRHGPKARYGWVANPCSESLLPHSRQGLSPCKIRRACLGAITSSLTSRCKRSGAVNGYAPADIEWAECLTGSIRCSISGPIFRFITRRSYSD